MDVSQLFLPNSHSSKCHKELYRCHVNSFVQSVSRLFVACVLLFHGDFNCLTLLSCDMIYPSIPQVHLSSNFVMTSFPRVTHDSACPPELSHIRCRFPDRINRPEATLSAPYATLSAQYNPKNPNVICGGQYNGQVSIWDDRSGSQPVQLSAMEVSHRDPVYSVVWLQTKINYEFFSASSDGQVRTPTGKVAFASFVDFFSAGFDIQRFC